MCVTVCARVCVFSQGEFWVVFFLLFERNVDCVQPSNHRASTEIQPIRGVIQPAPGWNTFQPPKKKINSKVFPVGFWPFTGPVKSAPSSVLQAAVMSLEPCMVDPSYQTFYKQSAWGEERGGACGASPPQNIRIIVITCRCL